MSRRVSLFGLSAFALTAACGQGGGGSQMAEAGRVVIAPDQRAAAPVPVAVPTPVAAPAPTPTPAPAAAKPDDGAQEAEEGPFFQPKIAADAVDLKLVDDAAFLARVEAAQGGEIIVGPSTPTNFAITDKRFSRPITIVGGQFHTVRINRSSGVRFVGATFARTVDEKEYRMLWITGSSDVSIDTSVFDGGGTQSNGINLQTAQDVSITNSRFTGLLNGVRGSNTDRVTVRGNFFTGILADSVAFASPRFLTVDLNRMENPNTVRDPHPDGLQIFDIQGVPSHDIVVSNNVMDVDAQGIWMTTRGFGGFDRVTIRGNRVNTGRPNAIALHGGRNSLIEDNEITTRTGAPYVSKLWVVGNARLTVRRVKVCKAIEENNDLIQYEVEEGWRCPR